MDFCSLTTNTSGRDREAAGNVATPVEKWNPREVITLVALI